MNAFALFAPILPIITISSGIIITIIIVVNNVINNVINNGILIVIIVIIIVMILMKITFDNSPAASSSLDSSSPA